MREESNHLMSYPLLPVPDVPVRYKREHSDHICECGTCSVCRGRVYARNAYRRRKAGIAPVHAGPHSRGDVYAGRGKRNLLLSEEYPDIDMAKVNAMWERVRC